MNIGFTGTRRGMTERQVATMTKLIGQRNDWSSFHHGDCIGADCQGHNIAQEAGISIVIHPGPTKTIQKNRDRAYCYPIHTRKAPKNPCRVTAEHPYLERNRHIVNASQVILATPDSYHERTRSGTWATIRFAIRSNRHVYIIWPDGTVLYMPPRSDKPEVIEHKGTKK